MSTPTPPGSLPWEWAARELALSPASSVDTIRRACEQWARSATEHWRQHDAEMHTALALCRSVLEEVRPIVKARLIDMDDLRAPLCDGSILDRIEAALKEGV